MYSAPPADFQRSLAKLPYSLQRDRKGAAVVNPIVIKGIKKAGKGAVIIIGKMVRKPGR